MDSTFLGIELARWLECLFYLVGAFIVGKFLSFLSTRILRKAVKRTKNRLDDIILAVVEKPLVLVILGTGAGIGLGRLGLEGAAALWSGRVVGVFMTLAVAWAVDRALESLVREYAAPAAGRAGGKLRESLVPLFRNGMRFLIWSLAVLIALTNAGYDVGALLAGLGIGGVAVAFAAKDTIANLFGSVSIFVDKSFALGDRIKVAGYDGTIKEIGIRTSRLATLDNRVVTVPNATFAASPIENVSSEPSTRVAQTIELDPGIGHELARRALAILLEAAAAQDGLGEGTVAALSGFARNCLQVTFIVFIRKGADYFGTLSALNLEVLRRFEEAGVELARPLLPAAPKA